jgi:hypothetical protein
MFLLPLPFYIVLLITFPVPLTSTLIRDRMLLWIRFCRDKVELDTFKWLMTLMVVDQEAGFLNQEDYL